MAFHFNLFEPKRIQQVNLENERRYITEEGNSYPSVTTALSYFSRKRIQKWKQAIGSAEAERISRIAARSGTALHNALEKYILHGECVSSSQNPLLYERFVDVKQHLDAKLQVVNGVELSMYSNTLQTAGTSDLICTYNDKQCIVDFKTSRRIKTRKDIFTYFMQCAAYAIMAEELYNFHATHLVILLSVEDHGCVEFVEKIKNWKPMTMKFFQLYSQGKFNDDNEHCA